MPASIDDSSPAVDIYRQFRGLIVSGQLGAGERLPTVRQTASDLGVAAGTAARAYRLLERDGLVVTRTAAGTRVSDSAGVVPRAVIRQIRELVAAAEEAGSAIDDVIDILRVVAGSSAGSEPH
nr:GntR family transcriptional regulator [Microbacterium hydrocarbonoxydans]